MIIAMRKIGLIAAVLSVFGNSQAADEHGSSNMPTGAKELASLTIFAGTIASTVGTIGAAVAYFPRELQQIVSPALYKQLLPAAPYAWLAFPAWAVALVAGHYLWRSAKGSKAKLRANIGYLMLTTGAFALVAGYLGANYALELRDMLMVENSNVPVTWSNLNSIQFKDTVSNVIDTAKRVVGVTPAIDAEKAWYAAHSYMPTLQDCYVGFGVASLLATFGISLGLLGDQVQAE